MAQPKIDAFRIYRQADRLLLGNNFKQAAVLYSRTIKSGPSLASELSSKYYRLGSCLYCQQKYEKAMTRYKKAAKLDFSLHQAYNGIGLCYLNLGEFEEAMRFFKICVILSPDYDLPHINRALALLLRDNEKEALDVFEKIKTRYSDTSKRDKVLEISQDEIGFANEVIVNSDNQDAINLARERIKGIQYILDLIRKV